MASIKDYLAQILTARYGKDVRQAIHDGIEQCYADGKAGSIDLEARQEIDELKNKQGIDVTTESTLQNSFNGGLRFTEMLGASEQATTTGKNLLPQRSNSGTNNGITFTQNADGSITVNGTATGKADFLLGAKGNTLANLPNGKYTLTGCPKGGSLSTYRLLFWNYDGTNVSANDLENGVTFEKTNTIADYNIAISVASGTTVNNLVFYPMLRLAENTDATFEPYSGGKPAPNPDYPQEIKSVSISGMQTHGKNFFPSKTEGGTILPDTGAEAVDSRIVRTPFAHIEGGDYDLSLKGDSVNLRLFYYDVNKNYLGYKDLYHTANAVKIAENVKYFRARWTLSTNLYDIQLEKYVATEYEPYQESVVTPTGFKLNAIGNVKDRLFKKDGLWQVERKLKEEILNGTETWFKHNTYNLYYCENSNIAKTYIVGGNGRTYGLCKEYPYETNNNLLTSIKGIFTMYSPDATMNMRFCFAPFESENVTTLDGWKARLQSNPVTVMYELATPTYEVLPLADQVALNSLLTFDGITYLDIESVLEPQFTLEYGISKNGGYTLQALNTAEANHARITAMETYTSNLASAILE